jgi:hypothetical protein
MSVGDPVLGGDLRQRVHVAADLVGHREAAVGVVVAHGDGLEIKGSKTSSTRLR